MIGWTFGKYLPGGLTSCGIYATIRGNQMEVTDIIGLQTKYGLTDSQFAEKLGIRRTSWNKIKKGKRKLTDKCRMRVYNAFPEAVNFLSSYATQRITIATEPHQPSQGGPGGVLKRLLGIISLGRYGGH